MCGIAGFLDLTRRSAIDTLQATAEHMVRTLTHRGPDHRGVWADEVAGIALGHRRLSIVDLSTAGHQPMVSADGRYVIVFNGEVYNHKAIRYELQKEGACSSFRGHSDTEVMLAAISRWGLEPSVGRFVGMFAFALWDRRERVLHVVRDRLGVKPLYYGRVGSGFAFGSELKAVRAAPGFDRPVDRNVLALYLRHGYIPAPYSIYEGIFKLPPGTMLAIPATDHRSLTTDHSPHAYWSAADVATRGASEPFSGSGEEAVDRLDALLRDAVRLRMEADVPLGAFLSGGVDSSAIVALMQVQSSRPVKTFTIGFLEGAYNEAEYAKAVARHLGTEHTELYVTPEEAISVISRLPALYDEPFADSSQIPTFLVSELTRRHVTVSLSGDGGDELFGGYTRYATNLAMWRAMRLVPRSVRRAGAATIGAVPTRVLDGAFNWLGPALRKYGFTEGSVGSGLHWAARLLDVRGADELFERQMSLWADPRGLVPGAAELPVMLAAPAAQPGLPEALQRMMYVDLVRYLPDDCLVKMDRASMGVGLEARVPLLDHRVVEFAWTLPSALKIRGGVSKWPLRQVLYRYVPRELIERPKMGFGVPIGQWLRGPLRDWAEDLLDANRLRSEGFLEPAPIRAAWEDHLARRRNREYELWAVLMFQAWLETARLGR
jgi:asparagine synthase (glutamine-hydrolysing)